jgi:hypothetical protein
MNFTAYPDVASALAAERHERFVATAEHSRRVSQLRRGRGDGSLAPRFVAALSRWLVDRTSEHTKGDVMDRKTFDALSRDLADGSTRRQFGKLFAALGLSTCGGSCGECPFLLPICNQITFACEPIVSIP